MSQFEKAIGVVLGFIKLWCKRSTKYNGSTIGFPSLVIYDTGTSDSGTYICSVSNKLGIGYSKPLQLLIRVPAKQTSQAGTVAGILKTKTRNNKKGSTAKVSMHRDSKTDGDITVTCSNNFYLPNCRWQHKSSLNQFKDLAGSNKYRNPATLRMTIKSFTFADRGSYRCKCYDKRRYYKYSSSMTIDIADARSEKRLNCRSGTQFQWKRNDRIINDNRNYSNTTSKVLTLLNVDWNDDGKYRCYYLQERWKVQDFYLVIQGQPEVNINENYYISRVGDIVTISGKIRILLHILGKRLQPSSSPDNLSPSMQQVEKVARTANLDSSLSGSIVSEHDSSEQIISSIENETVFKLSDVVCATLKNQEFLDSIIPLITEKVIEMVKPKIALIVDECIQPHLLTIKHNKEALILKDVELNNQKEQINYLNRKLDKIEARVEEQEQYSRRTSLRFHNVPAPTDDKGDIVKPIDTDSLILGICYKQLKLKLDTRDIGRSHPIGEIKDGKISIFVRFLSYRQRQLVFSNKRKLKGNTNKTFIAENLTKHRYNLLHRLNTLREKDTPFVSTSLKKFEVNRGLDTVLPCSHDSNPSPTNVYWTKNGVKIPVLSSSKYNGSTIGVPGLIVRGTTENDAGTYVCSVSNSIGTGYSTPIHLLITDNPSSDKKEYAYIKPLIISLSMISIILVFVGLMVYFKRCRRYSSHYESPDFKQDEAHRYSTARNADEYDLPNIQADDDDTVRTTGSLGDRNEPKETRSFTVHDFLQLFNDKDKYTRHVQLEFKNLTESYNSNQSGSEYYNTTASITVPQSNSIGQFWEFVSKNGVEHIILLTKENQQVTEFYPISDKPIEMKYLRLELDLSEKKNKNLFLFHLQLTNKEKQSSTIVKIYKTTNWKEVDRHLPLEVLAQLLDVTRLSKSKSSLIMTNDELDICMAGILKVCADVFRAIDDSTSFSIVQLATEARKQHSKLFQEIIDYELCYLLTHHHLESNHVYDAID
ncbi:HMCN [Mytilus edulis]|uniref:HMCN n=1 Tax=Mytilus edulis TaxID=6550 RepID=A0A8S3SCW2_MYTED|nr:HMCN [Mytilus edulis]